MSLLAFSPALPLRLPAEWEPQEAVVMSWPTYDHVRGLAVSAATRRIVQALSPHVRVDMLVRNANEEAFARRQLGVRNVRFLRSANLEIWTRDFGPIFAFDGQGRRVVVDFGFNYWGYTGADDAQAKIETGVERTVAAAYGVPVVPSSLISEGGNRESNGQGTLMMVEDVERHRNPGLSRLQIEDEFRRLFGIRTFIWIPRGVVEDDHTFDGPLANGAYTPITTGGHVDNIARFVGPNTVLLAHVSDAEARANPIEAENRRRLMAAEKAIREAVDAEGRPFRIVRIPTPDLVTRTMRPGDAVYDYIAGLRYRAPFPKGRPVKVALAASYLNFTISNGVVVTSAFYKKGRPESLKGKDAEAVRTLRQLFPGRKVVAIDTDAVNLGGGGIHCITQQVPRG